jgi:DNA-directed RNA polymerase subunit RPC12/RpoP
MPWFRCTACERRIDSPVVIGHGDCPHCGGDVVFDVRGEGEPSGAQAPPRLPLLRRLFRR